RDWDGALTPLLRKRLARHVESCGTCQQTRARARQLSAFGIVPLGIPSAEALRRSMSSDDLSEIASRRPADPGVWRPDGFPPLDEEADDRRRRRAWLWIAAALVCAILLIGGVAFVGGGSPARHPEATPVVRRSNPARLRAPRRSRRRVGVSTTTLAANAGTTVPMTAVSPVVTLPSFPSTVAVSGEQLAAPPHRDPIVTVPVTSAPTTVPHTVPPTTTKTTTTTIVF
ncbi:MAG TPA: hypothetical protein VL856_01865, partial [Acidimicrobiia bacterium]|nr:hypothetical protein [Acidimicrobiia bacterium]